MTGKRWGAGRPRVARPDFEKLYRELLFQLNHRVTGPAYSIQGIMSLDITDQEKLELIAQCMVRLEQVAKDIEKQHTEHNT
jgi:hypothetical protein